MKIEEMKRIADARTKGEFNTWFHTTLKEIPIEQQQKNMAFIAMAANNFDKLLAVVEAAKGVSDYHQGEDDTPELGVLNRALKALEEDLCPKLL